MSSFQASTIFTATPTTFFAVLGTTFSILFGPARKLYLQLLVLLHIAVSPFYIITAFIASSVQKDPAGGIGAFVEMMFVWLFFAVFIAPFLYTNLFGDLIYGVGKVYAGEVQPTHDSQWMSNKSRYQVGIVFLYAYIVIGICTGAAYCIAYQFEAVDDISNWDNWNPYYHQYTKSQMILIMILYTLGFILIIPFAGILLVAFISVLFEPDVSCKRLFSLCKENFCFIYSKFLGYIFGLLLLLALSFQMTYAIWQADTFFPGLLQNPVAGVVVFAIICIYWWSFTLIFPAITTILPIILYMTIRVRNEELTEETFADDIGFSRPDDSTSPLIPQGDGTTDMTDTNEVGINPSNDNSSHTNEDDSL